MSTDPKSFDAYLDETGYKPGLKTWLALRPALKQELDRHLMRDAAPSKIHEWLVAEHGFPLAKTAIVRYATLLKAGIS